MTRTGSRGAEGGKLRLSKLLALSRSRDTGVHKAKVPREAAQAIPSTLTPLLINSYASTPPQRPLKYKVDLLTPEAGLNPPVSRFSQFSRQSPSFLGWSIPNSALCSCSLVHRTDRRDLLGWLH
jgi:hypothetical protein